MAGPYSETDPPAACGMLQLHIQHGLMTARLPARGFLSGHSSTTAARGRAPRLVSADCRLCVRESCPLLGADARLKQVLRMCAMTAGPKGARCWRLRVSTISLEAQPTAFVAQWSCRV